MPRFTSVTPNLVCHDMAASLSLIVMPLQTQFHGMRGFVVTGPDGHLIAFAQRVAGN